MLNFYYWYSIITSFILILYLIPLSFFNSKLDLLFIFLLITSIILSVFLGKKYKKKFDYIDYYDTKKKFELFPLLIIVFLSIFEFIYAKDIPLFSVTVNNLNSYQDFETIPFLHVFISMLASYYSVKYFYKGISNKKNRCKNLFSFILINIIMLLYNMRSFFMISVFMSINLLVARIRRFNKIKFKHIVVVIFIVPILLFLFGGYGNMRQGYDWEDSSYIQSLGLYYNWPSSLPKQYMWSYSYITSPLANFNYNVSNGKREISPSYIYNFLPTSISKRMPGYNDKKECILIRSYFNVSTGFCGAYSNGGFIGLIIFWIVIMFFPLLLFRGNNHIKMNDYIICLTLYCGCVSFMFFSNMFTYGGTAPSLWFSIFIFLNKIKFRFGRRYKI